MFLDCFTAGGEAELICILMTVYKLLTECSGKNPKTKTETHAHQEKTWISWGFLTVNKNADLNSFNSAELNCTCCVQVGIRQGW